MRNITRALGLLLVALAFAVPSPARGAQDSDGGKTLNFVMYCETEAAMRTLVGHLAAGDEGAVVEFYMSESTPCYSAQRRVSATVVRTVARVPLPKGAVAVILEVRVHNKAGSILYVFMLRNKPAPNDTKGWGGAPTYHGDQRDV